VGALVRGGVGGTGRRVSLPRQIKRSLRIVWELACFSVPMLWEAIARRRGWWAAEEEAQWQRRHGARLRATLLRLGPTFIKSGQMLATRADLVPVEFLRELAALHDRVPPFSDRAAFAIIEGSLRLPLGAVFSEISAAPIAAASLGQVYRARLRSNGALVAVKVRRPNLARSVELDMAVLDRIARWIELLESKSGMFDWLRWLSGDWVNSVHEFERVLFEEMDYRREAANAERFAANFSNWVEVHVPHVYHEYSTDRVLVMEFIEGVKLTDAVALEAAGHDGARLTETLYRTYFKQLLEDGFFHADPHPGNLLVMDDGRLAFFDFGMVGDIDDDLQRKMVTAFFHLLDRDLEGIVDDLIALGFLEADEEPPGLRDVVAEAYSRRLEVRLADVKFRDLVYDLAPIVYEYPLTTPARFTFIIRALMTLEGISVQMNPNFRFLDVAKPYAKEFLFRREGAPLRAHVLDALREARSGKFMWSRLWRYARAAYSAW
jgi:predicted unusual protein kinase regulating ubiquinone biosynthesis (AarF/ABC1/UbiB family)